MQKKFNDGSVKAERGNVGEAVIFGFESLIDLNIKDFLKLENQNLLLNSFVNLSLIDSEYITSETPGVVGKKLSLFQKQI